MHSQGVPSRPNLLYPMQAQGAVLYPSTNPQVQGSQPNGAMYQCYSAGAATVQPIPNQGQPVANQAQLFLNQAQQAPRSLVADLELDSEPEDKDDEEEWDDAAFACIDAAVSRKHQSDAHRGPAQPKPGSMRPPSHAHHGSNAQTQQLRMSEVSFPPAGVTLCTDLHYRYPGCVACASPCRVATRRALHICTLCLGAVPTLFQYRSNEPIHSSRWRVALLMEAQCTAFLYDYSQLTGHTAGQAGFSHSEYGNAKAL